MIDNDYPQTPHDAANSEFPRDPSRSSSARSLVPEPLTRLPLTVTAYLEITCDAASILSQALPAADPTKPGNFVCVPIAAYRDASALAEFLMGALIQLRRCLGRMEK